MKDRIKFRVWDGQKLHYPMYSNGMRVEINDTAWALVKYSMGDDGKPEPNVITISGVTDSVLMACTGLKDRNGDLIWEGDVLKAHGYVIWNDIEYRWSAVDLNWNNQRDVHDLDYLTSPFEVIGNIYENPDLLT